MQRLAFAALVTFALPSFTPAADSPAVADLIRAAGNTTDESERFRRLRELEARPDLDAALRADLGRLLPIVDDWANGKARATVNDSRAAPSTPSTIRRLSSRPCCPGSARATGSLAPSSASGSKCGSMPPPAPKTASRPA
jgi:hypothetical protein